MSPKKFRRTSLALLLSATLLSGAACDSDEPTSKTPTEESSPSSSQKSGGEAKGFDTAMVKASVETGEAKTSLNVYLVDPNVETDGVATLNGCTEEYLGKYDVVSCFAFASDEAFAAAEVDEESAGMKYLCWSSFVNQNIDGHGSRKAQNPNYDEDNCP